MSPSDTSGAVGGTSEGADTSGGASSSLMPKNEIDDINQSVSWAAPTPDTKTEQVDTIGQNHMVPSSISSAVGENNTNINDLRISSDVPPAPCHLPFPVKQMICGGA